MFQDLWLPTPHQIRKFREKSQVHREVEERGTAAREADYPSLQVTGRVSAAA